MHGESLEDHEKEGCVIETKRDVAHVRRVVVYGIETWTTNAE